MKFSATPPPRWDGRVGFPTLSVGYARAMAALGHEPLYVTEGDAAALILVRSVRLPIVKSWTARAKVYVSRGNPDFLVRLLEYLAKEGVAHVRVGDAMHGVPKAVIEAAGLPLTTKHILRHLPARSEGELFTRIASGRRRLIRRADKADVVVTEVSDETGLEEYYALAQATKQRAYAKRVGIVLPPAYFEAIFRIMVPKRQAIIFLARCGDIPLAGNTFLISGDRMTMIDGASTRLPELARLQGPTAVYWHALRFAHREKILDFDLGAVTPTEDTSHPHHSVYYFKREFGGELAEIHHTEVVLNRTKYAFQERVMQPVWRRAHGFYLRAFGAR